MTNEETLDALGAVRDEIAALREAVAYSEGHRDNLARELRKAGVDVAVIAEAAGVTPKRIYQLGYPKRED